MSKTFFDYLAESKKTYEFKIGIAGELPEGTVDRLETALQKYSLENMSSGKKTPITERPLDFPQLQNTEVTYFETTIAYPTVAKVLEEYLSNYTGIPTSHIIVRNMNEPQEAYQEPKDDAAYETMLTKEEMEDESAQDSVAGNRVMDLLKELETARKERDSDPLQGTPKGESTDIGEAENAKSPVGS